MKRNIIFIFIFFIIINPLSTQVIIWTQQYNGGSSYDVGTDVTVDTDFNVYVTGYRHNGSDYEYFTFKYDVNGNTVWTQRYDGGGGNMGDTAFGVAIDRAGNCYVTGAKHINVIDFNYITIRYDSMGNAMWTQEYNSSGADWDKAMDIAVNSLSNIHVTGTSDNGGLDILTVVYSPAGVAIRTQRHNIGSEDAYGIAIDRNDNYYIAGAYHNGSDYDFITIKYDSSGNSIWTQFYDTGTNEVARDVAVDSNFNVYVVGEKERGHWDIFLVKYDQNGNTIWTQQYDHIGNDDGGNAIALDSFNNIYIAGAVGGLNSDFITRKYDPDGNLLWSVTYNGGFFDDAATGVAVDREHNVYVTGFKWNGADRDYFTIKYQQVPYTPVLVSVKLLTENSIQLTWQDIPNENNFIISRSTDGIIFSDIATGSRNVTSYIDPDIDLSTQYYYRIRGSNNAGESLPSNILAVSSSAIQSLDDIILAPNRFQPYEQGLDHVTFLNVPDEFELTVFTVQGKKVFHTLARSVSARYSWDVKDNEGHHLKSGIYFCHIKAFNKEKKLKLIVIR
ncbi:MAG: SBBP repeat-containing protein [Spirochaetes bacterium]|nr:SBBP repeat-containing protein [Spirochaetota bacterium]